MVASLTDLSVSRRRFMGGVAIGLSAMGWSAMGSPQERAKRPMPIVDALNLQILDDNATFGPFLSDLVLPGLQVRRHTGDAGATVMSRHALLGEFGLSILAASRRDGETVRVLVDFGYSREAISNNLAMLGIDLSNLDAAVLSHGHLDHYGGFPGLFANGNARQIPLYVGGEEAFCERIALIGNPPPLMGSLDRNALAAAGFSIRVASTPEIIMSQAFTTGMIPVSSTEPAAIPTQMRPGKGCDAAKLDPLKSRAAQIPDDAAHEIATC